MEEKFDQLKELIERYKFQHTKDQTHIAVLKNDLKRVESKSEKDIRIKELESLVMEQANRYDKSVEYYEAQIKKG